MKKTGRSLLLALILLMPLFIVSVKPLSAYTPDSWTTKAPMHEARGGAGIAVVKGKIYAIGGTTKAGPPGQYTGGFVGTNEEYDPETDTWTLKAPMPTPRADFRIEVVNNIIYCIGGLTGNGVTTRAFEAYDPATDMWGAIASFPTPREYFTTVVYRNRIYVIGGIVGRDLDAESRGSYTGITEVYDPASDRWQTLAPMVKYRYPEFCTVIDGKIYVISGSTTYYESVSITAVYDEATDSWTTKASMPFVKHGAAAVLKGKIYFVGGSYEDGDYVTRVQIYHPQTDTWTEGARPPNGGVVAAVAAEGTVSPRRIYVLNGGLRVYDPEHDNWTFGSNMTTKRDDVGIAVLNERIYAMGGRTMIFPTDLTPPPYNPAITTYATNEVYTPNGYGTPDPAYQLETTPPKVEVLSPLNQTYYGSTVPLTFSLDKQVSWAGYSLDGSQNVTIIGNCTMENMTNGFHRLTVYANDTFGNPGVSETIAFHIAESFPTLPILITAAVGAVVAVAGFLLYRKRGRGKIQ